MHSHVSPRRSRAETAAPHRRSRACRENQSCFYPWAGATMLLLSCAFRSAIGQKSAEANRSRFVEIAITTKVNFFGDYWDFFGWYRWRTSGEIRIAEGPLLRRSRLRRHLAPWI